VNHLEQHTKDGKVARGEPKENEKEVHEIKAAMVLTALQADVKTEWKRKTKHAHLNFI
jgi:hypothetical protein